MENLRSARSKWMNLVLVISCLFSAYGCVLDEQSPDKQPSDKGNAGDQPGPGKTRYGMREIEVDMGSEDLRSYLLYVPKSYRPGVPAPLVLAFHAGGSNATKMSSYTGFEQLSEREGFLIVYPNGTPQLKLLQRAKTWNTGSGRGMGRAEERGVDDLSFIRTVVGQIKSNYAIDSRRVFATGMSKGGMFTYFLACNMSDELAAIAPISATMVTRNCQPSDSIAIFHVHGTNDQSVPFGGGSGDMTGGGYDYPSVSDTIDFWRTRQNCTAESSKRQAGPDTVCQTYQSCRREITLCLVRDGGHAWPGTRPMRWQKRRNVYVTQTFRAAPEIWNFFKAHPKQ